MTEEAGSWGGATADDARVLENGARLLGLCQPLEGFQLLF